jgi:predicted metal-dependent hydrolase
LKIEEVLLAKEESVFLAAGARIILKRHAKAKRLKLRYDAAEGAAVLTLPPNMPSARALRFAQKHESWIQKQQAKHSDLAAYRAGDILPFRGQDYLICHDETRPARIYLTEGQITVGGRAEGFNIRLENWLKRQAKSSLPQIAYDYEEKLKQTYRLHNLKKPRALKKISIRDTKSRWGSCSGQGNISLSYRLIMAPEEIMNYVTAHEVAHLSEMNHSADFWKVVDTLVPNTDEAREWLNNEGQKLMLMR